MQLSALKGWRWDAGDLDAAWDEGLVALGSFVADHGHASVPQDDRSPDGYPLGNWVSTQRQFHRRGQLTPDQQSRLEAMDGWVRNLNDARWEAGFAALEAFVAEHGHPLIPALYVTPGGHRLGSWVDIQRTTHKNGALDDERERRLNNVPGWVWETKRGPREQGQRS